MFDEGKLRMRVGNEVGRVIREELDQESMKFSSIMSAEDLVAWRPSGALGVGHRLGDHLFFAGKLALAVARDERPLPVTCPGILGLLPRRGTKEPT